MNWEAISAIGEITGAIAVIITIGYFALQTKAAREASADANRLERSNGVREIMLATISSKDVREALDKGMGSANLHGEFASKLQVSRDEAFIVHWLMLSWFWLHWGQYASTTTKKDLDELKNVVEIFYGNPGVQIIWNNSPFAKPALDDDFVNFVEEVLKKPQNIG